MSTSDKGVKRITFNWDEYSNCYQMQKPDLPSDLVMTVVAATDYDQLQARVRELEAALDRAIDRLEHYEDPNGNDVIEDARALLLGASHEPA